MFSIIIPAHNEEKAIGRCLHALLPGAQDGFYEVLVVCNGCADDTAKVVAGFGDVIRCIETPIASKNHALNLGDEAASGFPRFYQDADVIQTAGTIKGVAEVLAAGDFLAAAPQIQMDYAHSSRAVQSYYDVWQKLPYVREGMIGTGVYALSKQGRSRFDKFPDIIADDGYVRALFKPHERTSVDNCYSIVRSPANLGGLLKIKTRSRLGGYELHQKFPELLENEEKDYSGALLHCVKDISLWLKLPVYLYVNFLARHRAKKHLMRLGATGWARDDTSRDAGNC